MSQIEVDKIIPQSGTSTQLGESGDTITIPAGATITNNGTANGFGSADTEKVKVSANDTTAGFLNGKLVAGTNISLTEGTDGGNETLTAALSGTIATAQIADDAVTLAKMAPGTDGNLITYDASGNPVAVATGSAGQVLTSAGAGAPPTFAAAGGGKVLQVVTAVDDGENDTTSTSFVATNLSVDITPSAATSKVFVTTSTVLDNKSSGRYMKATLYRDSTNLAVGSEGMAHNYSDNGRVISNGVMSILDSPSSTSQITYKVYIRTGGGEVRLGQNSTRQTITAFEIGA